MVIHIVFPKNGFIYCEEMHERNHMKTLFVDLWYMVVHIPQVILLLMLILLLLLLLSMLFSWVVGQVGVVPYLDW